MWWKFGLAVYVVLLIFGILFLQGAGLLEERIRRSESGIPDPHADAVRTPNFPRQLILPLSAANPTSGAREQPGLIVAIAARIAGVFSQFLNS